MRISHVVVREHRVAALQAEALTGGSPLSVGPVECGLRPSYTTRFAVTIVLPFIIAVTCALIILVRRLAGAVIGIARRHEDRFGGLPEITARRAAAHGECGGAPFVGDGAVLAGEAFHGLRIVAGGPVCNAATSRDDGVAGALHPGLRRWRH